MARDGQSIRSPSVGAGQRCRRTAVAVAAAAMVVAGCGQSDEQGVTDALADVQAAFAADDLLRMCRRMTPAARRHVGSIGHSSVDCPSKLAGVVHALRAEFQLRPVALPVIRRVVVDGDRAIATVESAAGALTAMPFSKIDGRWRLDALYGGLPGERQPGRF